MGIYWTSNSVFGMIRDYFLTKIFKKQLDEEDAARIAARQERDRDLELKRLETERKHAEGTNEKNANTSKKRLAAQEKNAEEQRQAALRAADRATAAGTETHIISGKDPEALYKVIRGEPTGTRFIAAPMR